MAGSITRQGQTFPIVGTATQATGVVTGSGTPLDNKEVIYEVPVNEESPSDLVNPAREDGHLATIATATANIPTAGQKAMAASLPVVIASDQSAMPISGSITATSDTEATAGSTTAPAKVGIIGGKTSDGTPQYQPLPLTNGGAALKTDASATTQPVSGTITANAGSGTFAISAAALPLPSGAATAAKQPALGTAGTAATDVITVQGIASMVALKVDGSAVTQPVSGTVGVSSLPALAAGTATIGSVKMTDGSHTASITAASALQVDASATTQPVSAASLPLPAGAATAAKQPSLGTAGTPAADVLTVQGAASMTALKVDGSAVTQPVSGTVGISGSVAVTNTGLSNIPTVGQKASAASLPVVLASDQSTVNIQQQATASGSQTLQNAAIANGNGSTLSVLGHATAVFTVSVVNTGGTPNGVINWEVTEDGANWGPLDVAATGSNTIATTYPAIGTGISGPQTFRVPVAGFQQVRARLSGFTNGSAGGSPVNVTVTGHAVPIPFAAHQVAANDRAKVAGTDGITAYGIEGYGTDGVESAPSGGRPTPATNVWPMSTLPNPSGGTVGFGLRAYMDAQLGLLQDVTQTSSGGVPLALQTVGGAQYLSQTVTTYTAGAAALCAVADAENYRWVTADVEAINAGAGGTATFQMTNDNSNSNNWVSCPLIPISAPNQGFQAQTTVAGTFEGPLPCRYFRVLVSGATNGNASTANVLYSSEPTGLRYLYAGISDGSNTAAVLNVNGTAAGQGALMVAPARQIAATAVTIAAPGDSAIFDAGNYRWVSVHITSIGTGGSVLFKASSDSGMASPVTVPLLSAAANSSNASQQAGSATIYHGPLPAQYFQVHNSNTAGTTTVTVEFSTMPTALATMGVSAAQGTAAALAGAWPVEVTDGTHTMPTMDAAARAGFVEVTDGANTANVLKADGATDLHASQNGVIVAGSYLTVTQTNITASGVGTAIDVGNYRWVSVHIVSQGSGGNVQFTASNDNNSDFTSQSLLNAAATGSGAATSTTNTGIFHGPLMGRYFQIKNTNTGGTTSVVMIFYADPGAMPAMGVSASQSGAWSLSAATSGGLTPNAQTALTNTSAGVSIKSSAGQLYGWSIANPNASVEYVQVFDVSTTVTLGTTAPTYVIAIPASGVAQIMSDVGIAHANAIKVAATTTPTGSTAPGTALPATFFYK